MDGLEPGVQVAEVYCVLHITDQRVATISSWARRGYTSFISPCDRFTSPSAVFTSQLKECHDREVTLKDMDPAMLETLLNFAYTGAVSITQANVQSLMAASNLLQVRRAARL